MSWIYERFRRVSEKNGAILAQRTLGRWRFAVEGYNQTSEGMNAIWQDTFNRLPYGFAVREVLILGLGAGGMVKDVYERFSDCRITAVEYDPTMIRLTREFHFYAPYPAPDIVEGDAALVIPHLSRKYDLVVIDLFHGGTPSLLLKDESFIKKLMSVLTPTAMVVANVAEKEDFLSLLVRLFAHSKIWRRRYNHLGIFTNECALLDSNQRPSP